MRTISPSRDSNPAGGEILPEPKRRFIAQSLSCSPFHRLEMTEILLKGRKTLTHPSIQPSRVVVVTCALRVPSVFLRHFGHGLSRTHGYVHPLVFRKMHMQVPCGPVRMLYENTRTISRVGRAGPMRGPYGAHRTQQKSTVRSLHDCLRTLYGPKITGGPCMNVLYAQYGSEIFEESHGFAWHAMRSSMSSQGLGPYGTRKLPGTM